MYRKYSGLFMIALLIGFIPILSGIIGCTTPRMDTAWPESRPVGKKFSSYQSPLQPSGDVKSIQLKEPTGVITLRQALSLALMKNPELSAFSWEVRSGEARMLQACLRPNPELEIEAEEFGGTDELSGFDSAATTLQLSQLIELGGKRSKRVKVAVLERDLAGWDYETKRLEVFTEVTKVFVEVLAAQEELALTEELVRLSEQVSNTVSERVKAGKVSPLEETKAKVTLSMSRINLEKAKRNLKIIRKRLSATWGSTAPTFKKVDGQFDLVLPIPSFNQVSKHIAQNPDIARWLVEIKQRKAVIELEKANRTPDLTIGGGMQRFNETGDNSFVFGISIPLTLFDRNQGGILEAKYNLAKAQEERKATEVWVHTRLSEAYQSLASFFTEAMALKNDVLPAAQQAFDAANEGYQQGKFGYLEVLDAQRTLFEVKEQSIKALSSYHQAKAEVERLIGVGLNQVKNTSKQNEKEASDEK